MLMCYNIIMINPEVSREVITSLTPILLEEATAFTDDVSKYEAYLEDRVLVENAMSAWYRGFDNLNKWSYGDGIYIGSLGGPNSPRTTWNVDAPLFGEEELWTERIDVSLSRKADSESPVVALDFGGGHGLSLMRIGAQEKYRQAIENGSLILAATNLGYEPSKEADEDGYSAVAKSLNARNKQNVDAQDTRGVGHLSRSPEELEFVQNNQDYVQFLDANALELRGSAVTMPDGRPVPLKGNVDFISEQLAVTHTHVPDIALGVFAELLRPKGALHLHTKGPIFIEGSALDEIKVADGRTLEISDKHEYFEQRQMALEVGKAAMTNQLGLKFIEDISFGPLVYSKQ